MAVGQNPGTPVTKPFKEVIPTEKVPEVLTHSQIPNKSPKAQGQKNESAEDRKIRDPVRQPVRGKKKTQKKTL